MGDYGGALSGVDGIDESESAEKKKTPIREIKTSNRETAMGKALKPPVKKETPKKDIVVLRQPD